MSSTQTIKDIVRGLLGYSLAVKHKSQRGKKFTYSMLPCMAGFTELQQNWFHDLIYLFCFLILYHFQFRVKWKIYTLEQLSS